MLQHPQLFSFHHLLWTKELSQYVHFASGVFWLKIDRKKTAAVFSRLCLCPSHSTKKMKVVIVLTT